MNEQQKRAVKIYSHDEYGLATGEEQTAFMLGYEFALQQNDRVVKQLQDELATKTRELIELGYIVDDYLLS